MNKILYKLHVVIPIGIWLEGAIGYAIINQSPILPTNIWSVIAGLVWLLPIYYAYTNLRGLFLGVEKKTKPVGNVNDETLHVVWVSRGTNMQALNRAVLQSIHNIYTYMRSRYGTLNVKLHVITDVKVTEATQQRDVIYTHVPKDFKPQNGAKYKARALEYWRRSYDKRGFDDWVFHCDEESIVTTPLIYGIHNFIRMHRKDKRVIGQGLITYNGGKSALIPSLVDTVRSGDDMGRFRYQYKVKHKALFGMHGSFILYPSFVMDQITWDMGGNSITEDAEFALRAQGKGYWFCWVTGYLQE